VEVEFQFKASAYLSQLGLTTAVADIYTGASKGKSVDLASEDPMILALKPLDILFVVIHK
jgi:hypothetical protein